MTLSTFKYDKTAPVEPFGKQFDDTLNQIVNIIMAM